MPSKKAKKKAARLDHRGYSTESTPRASCKDDGDATYAPLLARCALAVRPGGRVRLTAPEGFMLSTSGERAWRTSTGGRRAAEWVEVDPSPGNWHAGSYVYDGAGRISIAGSSDCTSRDFGASWACAAPAGAPRSRAAGECDAIAGFVLIGGERGARETPPPH